MTSSLINQQLSEYMARLFPICRSLSGNGNRETLSILQEIAPIEVTEYPALQEVYDWQIPPEWNIADAWIKDDEGKKLVDFRENNLHVVGYSEPVSAEMEFNELAPRLHYVENQSDAIPYRTSYYHRDWGFCVTAKQYRSLKAVTGKLSICIDSRFDETGSMTVGELVVSGRSSTEFLVSTYICHPSMANDNLSGAVLTAFLAKSLLAKGKPSCSWRFIFVPETIGALAYLYHNEVDMKHITGGLVVSCCGGPGRFGYKQTYKSDHLVDRACFAAFNKNGIDPICYPFVPTGSDERQYSSPGFRIPVATISKDKYYEYPEYHTSLDNLDFVTGKQLASSLELYEDVINILDSNSRIKSCLPKGEPNLGRRGLYPRLGGMTNSVASESVDQEKIDRQIDIINWMLFMADGKNDLLNVTELAGCSFEQSVEIARKLCEAGILALEY